MHQFYYTFIGRSTTRALEVGVRKALGAERKQLIRQFWGEAFLVTVISVVIGYLQQLLYLNLSTLLLTGSCFSF
jgi:putative ABC transport system permease protein